MKRLYLMFILLMIQFTGTYAQNITVKGTVTDAKGGPLVGVAVKVKDSKTGAMTNTSGAYTIAVPNKQAVLVFSYISYVTAEQVASSPILNVVLKDDITTLNDVVIVGYGEQQKKLISTAISSVSAKQIEDRLVATPAEALAGQVAGVNIAQVSGDPGSAPIIQVRGIGSISAGNSPLFVVDGYPLNNADNFNQINPADIQSIDVLKDAAAAAIYGSRGGNGIIIVTTKKGTPGITKFNFTASTGFQNVAKRTDVLSRDEYIDYLTDAFKNGGKAIPTTYNDPDNQNTNANTDWQDQIFRTGMQGNYALSASGGTNKLKFNITGSYYTQEGIIKATNFNRYTLRANIEAELTKKLSLSFNVAPSYTINDQTATGGGLNNATINGIGANPSGVGGTVLSALLQPPTLPVKFTNGDYSNIQAIQSSATQVFNGNPFNPLAVLDLYKDRTSVGRILSSTALNYEIVKGLKFKTSLGFEALQTNRKWYVPATLMSDNAPLANLSNPLIGNIRSRLTTGTNYNWVSENTLSYNKIFNKDHNLALLAGYSWQKNTYNEGSQYGQNGTITNSIVEYPNASGVILGTVAYSANALVSGFGRANYSYQNKYLFSASIRSDGSSRFGSNNKYAVFPAFSAAWRVSEEKFLKDHAYISELKLRGSYGVTGNNNIGDYSWQSYAQQINYIFGANNGTQTFGFAPSGFENKDLTWETNKQVDFGLELGLFKDRIYFTADVYRRVTSDLLFAKDVPLTMGFATSILSNVGEVRNNGLELALKTANLTGKLKWSTDMNIAFTRNKVLSLSDDGAFLGYQAAFGYDNAIRLVPGESMSSFYGYQQIGVYKDAADVAASPKWVSGGSNPGDLKYEDVNGDGKIDANDITNIGSPLPKFTYGITNKFNYKSFEFSFLLQGAYGNKIFNASDRYVNTYNGSFNVRSNAVNRWRSADEPGDGMTPRASTTILSSVQVASSRNIFDGSYLRVRNVMLAYSVPSAILKKVKLSNARIYLAGENLYTFTNYFGYNPEVNVWYGASQPRFGVDQGTYPVARTFSLGLNIGF